MEPPLGNGELGLIAGGDVLIVGDRSAAVGQGLDGAGARIVDTTGKLVLLGCIDVHHHLWQALIRGCGRLLAVGEWLKACVSPMGRLDVTAEDVSYERRWIMAWRNVISKHREGCITRGSVAFLWKNVWAKVSLCGDKGDTMQYTLLMVIVMLLTTQTASGSDPVSVQGALHIDGTSIALTHAYAMQYDNEEGLLEHPELRILLTDREVSPVLLSGPFLTGLEPLTRQGGVQGVLLRVEPGNPRTAAVHGTLLYAPKDPQRSLVFFSLSRPEDGFEQLQLINQRVVGQTRAGFTDEPAFDYVVSFNAPLLRDEVTTRLTREQALKSAHVRALLAYEAALREGNLEAVRNLSTATQFAALMAFKAQAGEAIFRQEIKREIPPAAERKSHIQALFVRGSRAFIVYQEKGAKTAQSMLQVDGTWKVD